MRKIFITSDIDLIIHSDGFVEIHDKMAMEKVLLDKKEAAMIAYELTFLVK